MNWINILVFCTILPAILSSNLLRIKRQNEPCICTPYYACGVDYEGKKIIDVYGTFQPTSSSESTPTCDSYMEVCCALPITVDFDTEYLVGPLITSPTPPTDGGDFDTPRTTPLEPLSNGSTDVMPVKPPGQFGCGVRRLNPLDQRIDTHIRITGNNDVPESTYYGEFPWMIAVFQELHGKRDFKCGGSLVAPDVVLTAAHCVAKLDANEVIVRAGEWDSRTSEEPIPHQDRRGQRLSVHKNFHSFNLYNDIALIFLEHPFALTETIDTICIKKIDFEPEHCFATGWGVNSFSDKALNQPILKKVRLSIVDRATCQDALKTTRLGHRFKLHQSFMCAGGVASQNTCSGDGGGPLVCSSSLNPNKFTQFGIVSWGIGCGNETPGVYSSVDYFHDWITSQLEH